MIMGDAEKVLAIVGEKDPYTPLPDVDELRSTGAVVQIYADAEHGFAHDASRPSHRPEDAADAFSRARDWMMTATS
jgi:dienelactone hydrolase